MFRFLGVCVICGILPSLVSAEIGGGQEQTIDFTQPEQAARRATWSDPQHLGCTAQGFGWDADKLTSRDGWIETGPLAIGTSWRPTSIAAIRIKVQTNYPMIEETSPGSKTFWAPGIHVRHSPDRVHWSDWQPTELAEDPRAPGTVLYTAQVGVPRRARRAYDDRRLEWSRREDIDWGSDDVGCWSGRPQITFRSSDPLLGMFSSCWKTHSKAASG